MLSLKQLYERGVEHSGSGNYEEAIKCYDEVLRVDSKSKETWNAKGTALTNQGKYDEAVKCFDEAIRLDANYTTPWNSKAIVYKNKGLYEEAIKCHEKALAINSNNTTAINGVKKLREYLFVQMTEKKTILDKSLVENTIPLSPKRVDKGHTIIGDKYALVNKINRREAEELKKQTGLEVTFPEDKHKVNFQVNKGNFGKLRLAKILKTNEFVAVKKVKGEEEIAASEQEAVLQNKVKGAPYVMPLLDSCHSKSSEDKDVLYQFMPLASYGNGDSLRDLLDKNKNLEQKEKIGLYVLKSLLLGLHALHKHHIYHLDLKPANMVFKPNGELLIIDFGCAVESVDGMIGKSNGDTKYFSPERFGLYRGEVRGFDGSKSDAWSLGVTLLEMLIGRFPFAGNFNGGRERILRCTPEYFEKALLGLPESKLLQNTEVGKIIQGLLSIDAAKRLTIDEALKNPLLKKEVFESNDERSKAFTELKLLSVNNPQKVTAPGRDYIPREKDENYAHYQVEEMNKNNRSSVTIAPKSTLFKPDDYNTIPDNSAKKLEEKSDDYSIMPNVSSNQM